jgi:hypothetical protein
MKKIILLLIALLVSGCIFEVVSPTAYRSPQDFVFYVDADNNVSWSGTLNGSYISGYGRRGYTLNTLPSCWDIRKTSREGLLRVYVQDRYSYSVRRYNDSATYNTFDRLKDCFR